MESAPTLPWNSCPRSRGIRTLEIVRAGSSGYAAQLLNGELDRLGALRKQVEREARQSPPTSSLSLETSAVVQRLDEMLTHFNEALVGSERDAARARDIIRSFVTRIEVTPIEPEGKPDGRGIGPVRVTVEGSLTELLGHASADRMIQRRGSTVVALNLPIIAFKYYVDITRKDLETVGGRFADIAVVSRLLDDASAPITRGVMADALPATDSELSMDERASLTRRADNAITHLAKSGEIVCVGEGPKKGWVWNEPDVDIEAWLRRAKAPQPEKPIGVMRVSAPEAFVVVVGSSGADVDKRS